MSMEAAMTGHLVFSTIHTNSSAETITRVFNLGALPYMVAGTFNLVMAQRLVRRVCSTCKKEHSVKDHQHWHDSIDAFRGLDPNFLKNEILARGIDPMQWKRYVNDGIVIQGTGLAEDGVNKCPTCNGSGYKGRV